MKLVFHCGSSKNGSTALQSFLLANYQQLLSRGIQSMLCSYNDSKVVSLAFANNFKLENLQIDSGNHLETEAGWVTSFGVLYEVYKNVIFKRDGEGLRKLKLMLHQAVARAAENNVSVIVISAEAFETSLCLKDPFFKRMIVDFSRVYDTEVVYYHPNPIKHIVASWLEWGWTDKIKYSDWIRSYFSRTTRSEFFSIQGGWYFSNLLNSTEWMSYWSSDKRFCFRYISEEKDVVRHFFQSILSVDAHAPDFKNDFSSRDRNLSWPKSLVTCFPLFFDFFCQDFEKFDVLRQYLIKKESEYSGDFTAYEELLRLTRELFTVVLNRNTDAPPLSNQRVDSLITSIEDIFNRVDITVFQRLVFYLCENLYYNHLRNFSDARALPEATILRATHRT